MNDRPSSPRPWIAPELEARLAALVLGEASDFERDELERLIASRAELGIYRQRLMTVHTMLRKVGQGEVTPLTEQTWKLDPKRRALLVAKLGGVEAPKSVVPLTKQGTVRRYTLLQVAAVLAGAGVILGMVFPSASRVQRSVKSTELEFAVEAVETGNAYDQSYDHTRSKMLREVVKGWEAPASALELQKRTAVPAPAASWEIPSDAIAVPPPTPLNSLALAPPSNPAARPEPAGEDTTSYTGDLVLDGETRVSAERGNQAAILVEQPLTKLQRIPSEESEVRESEEKLKSIILPSVEFSDTPLYEALAYLEQQSIERDTHETDPTKKGVKIALDPGLGGHDKAAGPAEETAANSKITLRLSNVPLSEALRYTSSLAQTKYKVDQNGVEIVPLSTPDADLYTNVYTVPPSFVDKLVQQEQNAAPDPFAAPVSAGGGAEMDKASPKELLERQGITFPAGSSVVYNEETSQLIVRNSPDQMELVEALVDSSVESEPASAPSSLAPAPPVSSPAPPSALLNSLTLAPPPSNRAASSEPAVENKSIYVGGTRITAGTTANQPAAINGQSVPLSSPAADLDTNEYGIPKSFGQELTARSAGAADPFAAPAPAAAPPLPAEAAAAPAKMPETVTATIASGNIITTAGTSASTRGTFGIEGEMDSLERKSDASEAGEKALDLFATAHVAEKAKQEAVAPAAKPADRLGESDSLALGSGGALALNGGIQRKEEKPVGESLQAIIALTGQSGQIDLGGTSLTRDRVIRQELPLEQEPLAKGLAARSGIVKFGAGDLEISGGGNFFDISKANFPTLALDELSPATEPFSTFSLHVSDVSFQLAQAALAAGQWPEAEKIRIEEFVNAFDYGDPTPAMEERVACRIDQAAHPFLQQRNLVRIALRTSAAGRTAATPLRLTILLDSSGSMERPDRRETVRRAFATLAGLLGENDRVTLITFARQPRLVADAVPGNEATGLAETVSALPSEGGTNLEAALQLGLEKAREHFDPAAQNRIVLMTDGATNLGDADAESLAARVVAMRKAGLAFDAAGFGADGVNDEVLEALTRNGDGRYYLLNRPEDAEAGFAQQIAGALRPSAKNVKVQVEFDPARVKSYRLLGFEKHRLNTEDFRNDAVDAAELAASEAGVAVYQVEPNPGGTGYLGSVSVRFRDLESDAMIERRWLLPYLASAPRPEQGATSTLLATVASQFAAKLAGGPLGDIVDLGELAKLAADLPDGNRIQELRTMIEQARELEGSP